MQIAVFGDSISEGIGSRKENYADLLKRDLEEALHTPCRVDNYALTGTTVRYIRELAPQWKQRTYDVFVLFYGNVDAMLRPDTSHRPNYYAHLPARYRRNGMLNPRPYYSEKPVKKAIQRLDSGFRWRLNRWLLRRQGETTLVSPAEFEELYANAVERLSGEGKYVVCCSTVCVSERFFPGTDAMYREFNRRIRDIAGRYDRAAYLDLYSLFREEAARKTLMHEDEFHPNRAGYSVIAEKLCGTIEGLLG